MASHERRNAIALDDAYFYCRQLENRTAQPDLYKVCNALHTLDLALEAHEESPMPMSLHAEAWQRVRDSLFATLVSSFHGYFFVYDEYETQVEPGEEWPYRGHVEFFPEKIHRKNESYRGENHRLPPDVLNPLRWAFADARQQVDPSDFDPPEPVTPPAPEPEVFEPTQQAARELLERLYHVCEEQAHEGKKKAHRTWWQLYWEADSCPNKRRKHEIQKQMVKLQSIWGTPAE